MKVIDQKDLNICYAHAASQLTEYHLRKTGSLERVHPAWLALLYSESKNKSKLEIGHTSEALDLIRGKSLCKAGIITARLQAVYQGLNGDIEILSRIEKENESPVRYLSELFNQCEEGSKLALPEVKRFGHRELSTHSAFESKILVTLAQGSPLSISYCANIWTKNDYEGIGFNELNQRDRLMKDCHYHESLVVGRKMIKNSCHFLVRNTWGNQWRKSNKNWNCLCQDKMTGELQDDCRFETHKDSEVVACWLPAATVAKNTGVITFLETLIPKPETLASVEFD